MKKKLHQVPEFKAEIFTKIWRTNWNIHNIYVITKFFFHIFKAVARCAPDRMIIEAYRPLGFVGEVYMFKNRKSCALKQVPSDIRDMMKLERVVLHSDKTECALTRTPDTPKVDCSKLHSCPHLYLQTNKRLS